MDLYNNREIAREVIMDHYQNPRHKHEISDVKYLSKHMSSSSCIDDITVYMDIEDGKVKDIAFNGVGCTISTASTSILTELLTGQPVEKVKEIVTNYLNMLDEKPYDQDLLQEANVFASVSQSANRINCATIGWRAVKDILSRKENSGNE